MAHAKLHSESDSRKRMTAERLRHLLHYDPATGIFTRRTGRFVGERAGSKCERGYWMLRLDSARYYAHRLAFLYMTGRWPAVLVDHINRDPADCRWSNLREADHSQNASNRINTVRRNKHGAMGLELVENGRWRTRICFRRRLIDLGTYDTREEAVQVYRNASMKLRGEYVSPAMLEAT